MTEPRKSDEGEPPVKVSENPSSETEDGRDVPDAPSAILPDDSDTFGFGSVGGHWKIRGDGTDDRFAVAHLTRVPPGVLAAPLHRHHEEDEYTYVLEGTLGTVRGDEATTTGPGTWVFKSRGQWHTFWNAGDEPAHFIEVVSPAGFESYFEEVTAAEGDRDRLVRINEEYGIEMDFESVPTICERFGLTFPEP